MDQIKLGQLDAQLEQEIADALGDLSVEDLMDTPTTQAAPAEGSEAGAPAGGSDQGPETRMGTVVAIRNDDVFVEFGGKDQGVCPADQFKKLPRVGDRIEFIVQTFMADEGLFKLARMGGAGKATWDTLFKGMVVEAMVTGANTGGLELKIAGHKAFMPASHIDVNHIENLSQFINQKLRCQVLELDKVKARILLSRRAVLKAEAAAMKEELLKTIEAGQIHEGTVRSIQPYGAFVDIGGMDGLLHVSDMAYSRVKKPEDVVKVGEKVKVKILSIDPETGKMSLGLKQIEPDPWQGVVEKYPPGTELTGRVTRLANFGAFVELEAGLEGLAPMGELSWAHVNQASDVLHENQTAKFVVLSVDPEKKRISLSHKQVSVDPWKEADRKYMPGAVVNGTVTRTAGFGAFVELEPGIEGLLHISQLSDKRVGRVEDVVNVGQAVQVKVTELDPDKRRIGLSIRALTAAAEGADAGEGQPDRASRDDMRKYISKPAGKKSASAFQSLMDKFGGGGGLKGGIG